MGPPTASSSRGADAEGPASADTAGSEPRAHGAATAQTLGSGIASSHQPAAAQAPSSLSVHKAAFCNHVRGAGLLPLVCTPPSAHHPPSPQSGTHKTLGPATGVQGDRPGPPRQHQLPARSQGRQPPPARSVCPSGGKREAVYLFMRCPSRTGTALDQLSRAGIQSPDGGCSARGLSVTASHSESRAEEGGGLPGLSAPSPPTVPSHRPTQMCPPREKRPGAGSVPWSPEGLWPQERRWNRFRNQQEPCRASKRGALHLYCRVRGWGSPCSVPAHAGDCGPRQEVTVKPLCRKPWGRAHGASLRSAPTGQAVPERADSTVDCGGRDG